jgi:secondary thiamine-phosphate synthase enzyme
MNATQDFEVSTGARCVLVPITDEVHGAVRTAGIADGICIVSVPHTTAGVIVNENADPDVASDVLGYLERLVPADSRFRHGEGNSDAHIKAMLAGASVTIPIRKGALALGTWQGIFFAEFDGPRRRRFQVTCVPAAKP